MTHYDYKVIPAPKKVKRVKGVSGAEELFAVTLTDAINEVARQGWEYVRAERLPAESPRGWLRARGRRGAGGAGVPPRRAKSLGAAARLGASPRSPPSSCRPSPRRRGRCPPPSGPRSTG